MQKPYITDEEDGAVNQADAMNRIDESSAWQAFYAKRQYYLSMISAGANVLMLLAVLCFAILLIPKINSVYKDLNSIIGNLQTVTQQLAEVDIEDIADDIDELVSGSTESLDKTLEKLEAIDIDTLNTAIQNLSDAAAPLANLANMFK